MRVRWLSAISLLALVGCGGVTSLSGTYMARDSGGVAILQLTENSRHKLLGSILVVTIRQNDQLEKSEYNIIGGSAAGASLTLTIKANQLFSQPENVGGQTSDREITLAFGTSNVHFSPATPRAFDAAVNELSATAREQQRERDLAQLVHDLDVYCANMEAHPINTRRAHDEEQALVAAARRDLALERQLNPQSFQASHVRFLIGNLEFQLGQIWFQLERAEPVWHAEIRRLDARVAANPCHRHKRLSGCDAFAVAKSRYASVRSQVLRSAKKAEAEYEQSKSEMTALNKEAGN